MSETLHQIYIINPATTIADNDLLYLVQSPYGLGDDAAIKGSDLKAMFLQPSQNLIDLQNKSTARLNLGVYLNYQNFNSGVSGDITLTNPLSSYTEVNTNGGSNYVKLPVMNASNSLTVGDSVTIKNVGSFAFNLVYNDLTVITSVAPSQYVVVSLKSNGTSNGTVNAQVLGSASAKDTGFFLQTANNLSDVPNKPTALSNIGALPLAGGTMTGTLVLNGDGTGALEAVTVQQLNAVAAGITIKMACQVATTAALDTTYDNGTAGVGATLTYNTDNTKSIDGHALVLGDRALVKDQADDTENGAYSVTDAGDVSNPVVLTRAADYDEPSEIVPGTLFPILLGTVNANSSWLESATVSSIGTDPIVFSQFTASPSSFLLKSNNLSDVPTPATARTNLGLAIGPNVQAWSAVLDAVAAGTYTGSSSITTLGTISTGVWHGTIIVGTYGGTGINNGSSTITIGGNIVFSGAHTFTGTLTGDTTITFPTSGTLATTAGTIANATNIGITDDTTTNATMYPLWVTTNTGFLPAKVSSTKITFNPSTATLTTTTFVGALTGNADTATTATNATHVATVSTSSNASFFPLFVASSSNSNQVINLGTGLSFNPSTNTLTTTTFSGALSGNATTATTATNATNVATTAVTTNATFYPLFVASSSNGNQAADLGTGLTFNPSTNTLTTTTFSGALSGNATTATTATNATNVATTAVSNNATYYPLFVASSSNGNQAADLGTGLTFNPSTNTLTTTTFSGALSGNATTATTATNATNIAVTDDTTTNATMYPLWVTTTTGNLPAKLSSTKITFNPSTGLLTTTSYAGIWAGFTIAVSVGGTGATSFTAYMPICGGTTTTGALQSVSTAGASPGYVLTYVSSSAIPTWQATSGSGTVNSGSANQLAYYAGAGTAVSGLATANNGVVVTDGSGVPSVASMIAAANLLPLGGSGVTAIGSTTFNLSTATGGTVTVSGLAFQPSLVMFFGCVAATATAVWGWDNGTQAFGIGGRGTSGGFASSTSQSVLAVTSAGNSQSGHITAFSGSGFTVTFTKAGAPTGTLDLFYLAIK